MIALLWQQHLWDVECPQDRSTSSSPSCQAHHIPSCLASSLPSSRFSSPVSVVKQRVSSTKVEERNTRRAFGLENIHITKTVIWEIITNAPCFPFSFQTVCGLRCLGTSASPVPFQRSKGLVLHQPGAHRQMLNSHVAPGSSLGLPILRPARIKKRRTLGSLFPAKKGKYYCCLHLTAVSLLWEYCKVRPALRRLAELGLFSLARRLRGIWLPLNMMWG